MKYAAYTHVRRGRGVLAKKKIARHCKKVDDPCKTVTNDHSCQSLQFMSTIFLNATIRLFIDRNFQFGSTKITIRK